MNRTMMGLMMLMSALHAIAQDGPRVSEKRQSESNSFICFVNVAHACDMELLKKTVEEFLPGLVPAHIKAMEADSFGGVARFNIRQPDQRFGKDAKLIIYVVNDIDLPHLMSVPGYWSLVNIRGLNKGASPEKYERRIRQMMLKGLAFSLGVGANMDVGRCVMSQGSFDTLTGIDSTSVSYSPYAAGPIIDILRERNLLRQFLDKAE